MAQNKADYERGFTVKSLKRDLNMYGADYMPVYISIDGNDCLACHLTEYDGKFVIQGSAMNFPDEENDFQDDDVRKSFQRERDFLLNKDYDLK